MQFAEPDGMSNVDGRRSDGRRVLALRSLKSNFVPIDRRNRDLPLRFSGESLSDWLVRSAKVSRALNEAA